MKATVDLINIEADWIIRDHVSHILLAQYKSSAAQTMQAVTAMHGINNVKVDRNGKSCYFSTQDLTYRNVKKKMGESFNSFYVGIVVNTKVGKEFLVSSDEYIQDDFYNYLNNNFKYPLLPEWKGFLFDECLQRDMISTIPNAVFTETEQFIPIGHGVVSSNDVVVYSIGICEETLGNVISYGLSNQYIRISDKKQVNNIDFSKETLDTYMYRYSNSISEHLDKENLRPLHVLKKDIDGCTLKSIRLKAAQAACVNGVIATMQRKKDNFIFMTEEMGCGKTIQALSAVEGYYNQQWLKAHPNKTLKDCFLSKEVSYRTAVLCPPLLCEKWKKEIEAQIPGAKAFIVHSNAQLSYLRKHRKERHGKEIFIFSKDYAKAETYKRPVPTKIRSRFANSNICMDCLIAGCEDIDRAKALQMTRRPFTSTDVFNLPINVMYISNGLPTCPSCKGHHGHAYSLDKYGKVSGLVCPSCDNILLSNPLSATISLMEEDRFSDLAMLPKDFSHKTTTNATCKFCGSSLWEDNVVSMDIKPDLFGRAQETPKEKSSPWKKIKFYSDYAKAQDKEIKMNKTGYTLPGYERSTVSANGVIPVEYDERNIPVGEKPFYCDTDRSTGPRRFSPARYAKKYLKGCFDVLIVDEAHQYSGVRTEQAIAAHCLMKVSKFKILMTGTISNGTAKSLFTLLYMTMPHKMKEYGYNYTTESLMEFSKKYGVVETTFEYDSDKSSYNAQGRGRQLNSPTVRAGISALIYPHFFTDHFVMLDMNDMSSELPELKEYVVKCDLPDKAQMGYMRAMSEIRDALRDSNGVGKGLVGTMLQFGLSYPDKPYGRKQIYSLCHRNAVVVNPVQCDEYETVDVLLPKEVELVNTINNELAENRNCFVYTCYSNKEETNVNFRFKEVIKKHCNLSDNEVMVLESNTVSADRREEYIKKHSSHVKVWITNYANVEVGIDFCGKYNGCEFNYPTIIYMQVGLILSQVWQSSRRAYRLNQTQECRTYYMVYDNTFQSDMLVLMSRKISAASAIQGNFSASALQNMMGTEDPQIALAKKLTSGVSIDDGVDVESLLAQTRHNIISYSENIQYEGSEPLLYDEVMGEAKEVVERTVEEKTVVSNPKPVSPVSAPFFAFTFNNPFAEVLSHTAEKTKKVRKSKNVLKTSNNMTSIALGGNSFGFGSFGF